MVSWQAAANSTLATYTGSGGPGVAVDFDALYRTPCADPAEWRGRTKPQSTYSKEMQEKQVSNAGVDVGATGAWVWEEQGGV